MNLLINNRKKRNAFYYKILILLICSMEVFLLTFISFISGNFENIIYENITNLNYEIVTKVGNNVANMSRLIDTFCNAIYFDPTVSKLMYNDGKLTDFEVQSSLNRVTSICESYGIIDSVIIYNKNTDTFYSAYDSYLGDEILDTIKNGGTYPEPIVRSLPKEHYYRERMVLTYFKSDNYDLESNIVVINVKLDWLESLFAKETSIGTDLYLINSSNDLILGGSNADEVISFKEELLNGGKAEDMSRYKSIYTLKKENAVVMFCEVPETDWYLVNRGSYDTIYSSVHTIRKLTFSITVVFMIAGVVLALLLARNLYKPLKKMLDTIGNNFGEMKNETSKTDIQYITEAVSYSKNFSKMLDSYVFKELLTTNGQVSEEKFSQVAVNNSRFSGDFSVCLVLVEIFEMPAEKKENVKDAFGDIDCDFVDIGYDSVLVIMNFCERFKLQEVERRLENSEITLCISEECNSVSKIVSEYKELIKQSKYKLIFDGKGILDKEKIAENMCNTEFVFPETLSAKIISALEEKSLQKSEIGLQEFLKALSSQNISNFLMALIKLQLMLSERYGAVSERQSYYLEKILEAKTKHDVKACFREMFFYALEEEESEPKSKRSLTAEVIKDYISNNFADSNLSVKTIAADFKMSQAYVGRLFKKSFGCTMTEYVNKMRIEKSLELLKNTNRPISAIMREVGYVSESTFFKIFKDYCNTTPKGYRISLVENNEE